MSSIKYQGKYRIPSARASFLDYGAEASYFVTICTKGRKHYFGKIRDGKMRLSPVGVIADVLWHQIGRHFPNWESEVFIVMPNHIHGVLTKKSPAPVETGHALSPPAVVQPRPNVPHLPRPIAPHPRLRNPGKNTLSTVVGSYKSAVTRNVRRLGFEFAWQTRFHDHVIRNDHSHQRIIKYIRENVANWQEDCFHD